MDTIKAAVQNTVTSIQAKRTLPPVPSPIPEKAAALRKAARLDKLRENEVNFESVRSKCVNALAKQLGLRYSPARSFLSAFKVYDQQRQGPALQRMAAFIAGMEENLAETRGLVLYGSVGTGKDHLLAAVLYEVASASIPTAWVSGEDIFLQIRDSMDTNVREEVIIDSFIRPVVLGISDPIGPRGNLSEWNAGVLARLLDRRYRALRPTWLTMNAVSEEDAKEKLGPVIWDRFRDTAEVIPCFWPSYRGMKGGVPCS